MITKFIRGGLMVFAIFVANPASVQAQLPTPGGTIDPIVPVPLNSKPKTLPPTTVQEVVLPERSLSIQTLSHSKSFNEALSESDRQNFLNHQRQRFAMKTQMVESQRFQRPLDLTESELAEIEKQLPPVVNVQPVAVQNRLTREFPLLDENEEIVDMRTDQVLRTDIPNAVTGVLDSISQAERSLSYPERNSPQVAVTGLFPEPDSPIESGAVDSAFPEISNTTSNQNINGPFDLIRSALSPIPAAPKQRTPSNDIEIPQFNEVNSQPNANSRNLNQPFEFIRRALSSTPSAPENAQNIGGFSQSEQPGQFLTEPVVSKPVIATPVFGNPSGHESGGLEAEVGVNEVRKNKPFSFVKRALSPIPNTPQPAANLQSQFDDPSSNAAAFYDSSIQTVEREKVVNSAAPARTLDNKGIQRAEFLGIDPSLIESGAVKIQNKPFSR